MKLVTFTVPCYNSEAFMSVCIDSLLTAGNEAEIIIINDGSRDMTGAIADEYAARHPDIVRVVHQENGGHGSGVNAGMERARGLYFKVVDSDDWLDRSSIERLMDTLRGFADGDNAPDLIVCDYSRVKQGTDVRKRITFHNALTEGKVMGWGGMGRLGRYQYMMMHALLFRTSLLRACGLKLPRHMFYVDMLFTFTPMFHVRTLYYMRIPLYQYLVGQAGQSVHKDNVIRNIDHMLHVCDVMTDTYLKNGAPPFHTQDKLLTDSISLAVLITSVHLIMSVRGTSERNRALWEGIRAKSPALYRRLSRHPLGILASGCNPVSDTIARLMYGLADAMIKIN